jgi:hypothetical protein
MEGLKSWTKYKDDITKLRQFYDFTHYLYNKEVDHIKQLKRERKVSFWTDVGTTCHSVDALLDYTRRFYPQKLRELVLISLISSTEKYYVRLIKEIYSRDTSFFKCDERFETSVSEILSHKDIDSIGKKIIEKDARSITSGGISIAMKYYKKRFGIDFHNLGISFLKYLEYFDRRHLFVHANGIIDRTYHKKYSSGKIGERINITSEYIADGFNLFLEFGKKLRDQLLVLAPDSKRASKQYIGSSVLSETAIYHIELHINNTANAIDLIKETDLLIPNKKLNDILLKAVVQDENRIF